MLKRAILFFVFLLVCVVPGALSYGVFNRLKSQSEIIVSGNFRPCFGLNFTLRDAFINWRGKVEADTDVLEVNYSLFDLLKNKQIHVKLTSQEVRAKLKGEWENLAPVSEQFFKDVVVEISFKEGKLNEIYQINAQSEDVHFQFGLSNYVKGH